MRPLFDVLTNDEKDVTIAVVVVEIHLAGLALRKGQVFDLGSYVDGVGAWGEGSLGGRRGGWW